MSEFFKQLQEGDFSALEETTNNLSDNDVESLESHRDFYKMKESCDSIIAIVIREAFKRISNDITHSDKESIISKTKEICAHLKAKGSDIDDPMIFILLAQHADRSLIEHCFEINIISSESVDMYGNNIVHHLASEIAQKLPNLSSANSEEADKVQTHINKILDCINFLREYRDGVLSTNKNNYDQTPLDFFIERLPSRHGEISPIYREFMKNNAESIIEEFTEAISEDPMIYLSYFETKEYFLFAHAIRELHDKKLGYNYFFQFEDEDKTSPQYHKMKSFAESGVVTLDEALILLCKNLNSNAAVKFIKEYEVLNKIQNKKDTAQSAIQTLANAYEEEILLFDIEKGSEEYKTLNDKVLNILYAFVQKEKNTQKTIETSFKKLGYNHIPDKVEEFLNKSPDKVSETSTFDKSEEPYNSPTSPRKRKINDKDSLENQIRTFIRKNVKESLKRKINQNFDAIFSEIHLLKNDQKHVQEMQSIVQKYCDQEEHNQHSFKFEHNNINKTIEYKIQLHRGTPVIKITNEPNDLKTSIINDLRKKDENIKSNTENYDRIADEYWSALNQYIESNSILPNTKIKNTVDEAIENVSHNVKKNVLDYITKVRGNNNNKYKFSKKIRDNFCSFILSYSHFNDIEFCDKSKENVCHILDLILEKYIDDNHRENIKNDLDNLSKEYTSIIIQDTDIPLKTLNITGGNFQNKQNNEHLLQLISTQTDKYLAEYKTRSRTSSNPRPNRAAAEEGEAPVSRIVDKFDLLQIPKSRESKF